PSTVAWRNFLDCIGRIVSSLSREGTNRPGRRPAPGPFLLLWFAEIVQIRRLLALLAGHQLAIGATHVYLAFKLNVGVAFRTDRLDPDRRLRLAHIPLVHRVRTGQRTVDRGDVVVQDILVRLVEIEPLLDEGLPILVHEGTARIEGARILQEAG